MEKRRIKKMKNFFKTIAEKAKPIIKRACSSFVEGVKAAVKEFVVVFIRRFFDDDGMACAV